MHGETVKFFGVIYNASLRTAAYLERQR